MYKLGPIPFLIEYIALPPYVCHFAVIRAIFPANKPTSSSSHTPFVLPLVIHPCKPLSTPNLPIITKQSSYTFLFLPPPSHPRIQIPPHHSTHSPPSTSDPASAFTLHSLPATEDLSAPSAPTSFANPALTAVAGT